LHIYTDITFKETSQPTAYALNATSDKAQQAVDQTLCELAT